MLAAIRTLIDIFNRKTVGWMGGLGIPSTVLDITTCIIDSAEHPDLQLRPLPIHVARAYSVRAYHSLELSGQCGKGLVDMAITLLCDAVQDAEMAAELNFVTQATLAVAFAFVDTTFGLLIGNFSLHPGMKRLFDEQKQRECTMKAYNGSSVSVPLSASRSSSMLTLILQNIPSAIKEALISPAHYQDICNWIAILLKEKRMIY